MRASYWRWSPDKCFGVELLVMETIREIYSTNDPPTGTFIGYRSKSRRRRLIVAHQSLSSRISLLKWGQFSSYEFTRDWLAMQKLIHYKCSQLLHELFLFWLFQYFHGTNRPEFSRRDGYSTYLWGFVICGTTFPLQVSLRYILELVVSHQNEMVTSTFFDKYSILDSASPQAKSRCALPSPGSP